MLGGGWGGGVGGVGGGGGGGGGERPKRGIMSPQMKRERKSYLRSKEPRLKTGDGGQQMRKRPTVIAWEEKKNSGQHNTERVRLRAIQKFVSIRRSKALYPLGKVGNTQKKRLSKKARNL